MEVHDGLTSVDDCFRTATHKCLLDSSLALETLYLEIFPEMGILSAGK